MVWIVAFVSQKGGIGKSTGARALATEATAAGIKTKLADLDTAQATSADWHRRRLDAGLKQTGSVEIFSTVAQAVAAAGGFDLLIIDGPARANKGTADIAKVADLLIQPTGASLDDLIPGIKVFNSLVQAGTPKNKLIFALNRIGTEAEENDARIYIQMAGYAVLDGCLMEKPAYRKAQNSGLSVTETRYSQLNERAKTMIQSLINKIGE